jgi:hypothetical protein
VVLNLFVAVVTAGIDAAKAEHTWEHALPAA